MNILNLFKKSITGNSKRFYDSKVVQLFNQPKNVGSLDKSDPNVGTAIVGAPACFHGDTDVFTKDGIISLKELFNQTNGQKIFKVWSYNIEQDVFELKSAIVLFTGYKDMDKITFNGDSTVIVTRDHKFLSADTMSWKENSQLQNRPLVSYIYSDNKFYDKKFKIIHRKTYGPTASYTLQVEENNNYLVALSKSFGIVVKNCGDVMKLQIKVDDKGNIVDAKTRVFGCASAIASSSLSTELIIGKTLEEAQKLTNKDIATQLNLPPVKLHCSMLAEDSIKQAIEDVKRKQSKKD